VIGVGTEEPAPTIGAHETVVPRSSSCLYGAAHPSTSARTGPATPDGPEGRSFLTLTHRGEDLGARRGGQEVLRMSKATILAVDDDPMVLRAITRDPHPRYDAGWPRPSGREPCPPVSSTGSRR